MHSKFNILFFLLSMQRQVHIAKNKMIRKGTLKAHPGSSGILTNLRKLLLRSYICHC